MNAFVVAAIRSMTVIALNDQSPQTLAAVNQMKAAHHRVCSLKRSRFLTRSYESRSFEPYS